MSEKLFHSPNNNNPSTQKELAESYGITQQTMNNYMRMADMIPESEDLAKSTMFCDRSKNYEAIIKYIKKL